MLIRSFSSYVLQLATNFKKVHLLIKVRRVHFQSSENLYWFTGYASKIISYSFTYMIPYNSYIHPVKEDFCFNSNFYIWLVESMKTTQIFVAQLKLKIKFPLGYK